MQEKKFTRHQVKHSFRAFGDLVGELENATLGTWGPLLCRLAHHCTNDPVMRAVTDGLQLDSSECIIRWSQECSTRGQLSLPHAEEKRLSRLFSLILVVAASIQKKGPEFNLYAFTSGALQLSGIGSQAEVLGFTDHIIRPFARDLQYRLDDILEDTVSEEEVGYGYIVQQFSPQINIGGDVRDSTINVQTGDNTIVCSEGNGIDEALAELRAIVESMGLSQEAAEQASRDVKVLASVAETDAEQHEASDAAGRLAKHVKVREWMGRFVEKVSVSLATNVVVLTIKSALEC